MDLGLEIEETKAGIRISILQIHCVPVFSQNGQFWLFLPNLSKNGFRFWNSENQCRNKNQHAQDTMCTNFHAKHAIWLFVAQIYPKMDLTLEIEKTNAWIRITILETTCVPIFGQNRQIWLSRSKFAQK